MLWRLFIRNDNMKFLIILFSIGMIGFNVVGHTMYANALKNTNPELKFKSEKYLSIGKILAIPIVLFAILWLI